MLHAVPISQQQANAYVAQLHRHHAPVRGDKYRLGVADDAGNLCGVVQVGRPVSRHLDDGNTLEVVRLCSDGSKDVCSFLYARAARVARELGYKRIITYILEDEPGTSLRAAGWTCEEQSCGGGSWSCPSRPRSTTAPTCRKQRWGKCLQEE